MDPDEPVASCDPPPTRCAIASPDAAAQPLVSRNFVLLVIGHTLQGLGYALMPLLPLYLGYLEATRAEIGAIMAASAVGGLALRPIVGWALDALGRKVTLVFGTVCLVLGMVLIFFVTSLGPFIYVVRVITGIGIGTLFTAYFAYATDIIPTHRRTEGIALFGISGLVPMAVGPFVYELGIEGPDIRWFFPLVGGLIALSLIVIFMLPEPDQTASRGKFSLAAVWRALRHRSLWPVWVATWVFATAVATFLAFAVVSAEDRGIDHPATMWFTYAGGAIAVRLIGARLPDRVGPHNIVAPALGVYTISLLIASGASTTWGLAAAGLLAGLGHGYCFPVLTSQVVSRVSNEQRGSALAMFTGLWDLSALAMTPVMGLVADAFDDATMFVFTAFVGVMGLGVWVGLEHWQAVRGEA